MLMSVSPSSMERDHLSNCVLNHLDDAQEIQTWYSPVVIVICVTLPSVSPGRTSRLYTLRPLGSLKIMLQVTPGKRNKHPNAKPKCTQASVRPHINRHPRKQSKDKSSTWVFVVLVRCCESNSSRHAFYETFVLRLLYVEVSSCCWLNHVGEHQAERRSAGNPQSGIL